MSHASSSMPPLTEGAAEALAKKANQPLQGGSAAEVPMAFPKPSPELSALLEALAEADDRLERRKMFGSSAVFLTQNRQMLAGVFGEQFHVRLSEADREAVRARKEAARKRAARRRR